jgi:RimJ/RimL family protein N-acetyltransferase
MLTHIDAATFTRRWDWFKNYPCDRGFLAYSLANPSATLFTDDLDQPLVALLGEGYEPFCFVEGDARCSEGVIAALTKLRQQRNEILIISVVNRQWHDALLSMPQSRSIPRIDYEFQPERFTPIVVHDNYKIAPMTPKVIERVLTECDPDFCADVFHGTGGIGYVAMHGEKIVSSAWAPTLAGIAEISVATVEPHRRRNLAAATASALIQECLKRNIRPHFTIDQRNTAARAVALKLGFMQDILHEWIVLRAQTRA